MPTVTTNPLYHFFGKNLYKVTGHDWSIRFELSLTEPTTPAAIVYVDDDDRLGSSVRYTAWGNTSEEAMQRALELVYTDIFMGKPVHGAPWTNDVDRGEMEATVQAWRDEAKRLGLSVETPDGAA